MSTAVDERGPIEVVICDRQPCFAQGLAALLEVSAKEIRVAGVAICPEEILEVVSRTCPDVVLMDTRIAEGGGIETTRRIRASCPSTKVVMMAASDDCSFLAESLRAGATGYVLKDKEVDQFARAVRSVYNQQVVLPAHLAEELTTGVDPSDPERLTREERRILMLLGQGATNSSIASHLHLSERTVKRRIAGLYVKLGLAGRREAMAYAWQQGLVLQR